MDDTKSHLGPRDRRVRGADTWTRGRDALQGQLLAEVLVEQRQNEAALPPGLRPVRGRVPRDRRPALLRLRAVDLLQQLQGYLVPARKGRRRHLPGGRRARRQHAFYEVYVDYGEGPVYFGLYTMSRSSRTPSSRSSSRTTTATSTSPRAPGASFAAGRSARRASTSRPTRMRATGATSWLLFDALHAETRTSDPGGLARRTRGRLRRGWLPQLAGGQHGRSRTGTPTARCPTTTISTTIPTTDLLDLDSVGQQRGATATGKRGTLSLESGRSRRQTGP